MFPKVMKMIKVEREYPIISYARALTPVNGAYGNTFLKYPYFITGSAINFYSGDFLGLNFQMKNELRSIDEYIDHQQRAKELLGNIFKSNVELFFDEKTIHFDILNRLVSKTDIIVVDQFVNTNMELASECLKKKGLRFFKISHHNLKLLEEIIKNADSGARVWYLAQGTYSVPGDMLPVAEIKQLLGKYPSFYIYADDSDSLGWMGVNGCGFIHENFAANKRVVVSASLNKGFGAEGGIVVLPGEFTSTWGIQPLSLQYLKIVKSIICSAENMLNNNLSILQSRLQTNIRLFHNKAQRKKLPVISHPSLPMIFVAAGTPKTCGEICAAVWKEGMFVSSACYPLLPVNRSGIKFNITLRHSVADIKNLIDALAEVYKHSLTKKKQYTSTYKIMY